MLVHVTRFQKVQEQVHEAVKRFVKNLRDSIVYRTNSELVMSHFQELWDNDFLDVNEKFMNADSQEISANEYGLNQLPGWDIVKEHVVDVLEEVMENINMINGASKDILQFEEKKETGLRTIVIGGDKLARGLTLEGLTVSYFMRTSKLYDSLMQMGRWFGYRNRYLDLCRLYITEELDGWFTYITNASEELREEFEMLVRRDLTPEDYGLKVRVHPILKISSPNKTRSALTRSLSFSGNSVETIGFGKNRNELENNFSAICNLVQSLKDYEPVYNVRYQRTSDKKQSWDNSYLWNDIPAEYILRFLQEYKTHPSSRKAKGKDIYNFVSHAAQDGKLLLWNVAFFSGVEDKSNGHQGNSPVLLSDSVKIFPVIRTYKDNEEYYAIGRLLSPRDETIDIENSAWQCALKISEEEFKKNPGRGKSKPEIPRGPVIRRLRGYGCSEEGISPTGKPLLLLYLINVKDEDARMSDLSSKIAAFGISFPGNITTDEGAPYAVNSIYQEEYDEFF